MKIWIERALAGVRWVWEKLVVFAKWTLAKLTAVFNTVYDPPPKTIRFWFWSWTAMVVVVWVSFAFVNSWFYKPTAQYFTSIFEDGDVFIPDHIEPLPSVATPAIEVPSVEVVCHDMSDTPQCEPVKDLTPEVKKEVSEIPPPVAKSPVGYKAKKSPTGYKRRKHQSYVTYWGF